MLPTHVSASAQLGHELDGDAPSDCGRRIRRAIGGRELVGIGLWKCRSRDRGLMYLCLTFAFRLLCLRTRRLDATVATALGRAHRGMRLRMDRLDPVCQCVGWGPCEPIRGLGVLEEEIRRVY